MKNQPKNKVKVKLKVSGGPNVLSKIGKMMTDPSKKLMNKYGVK